MRTHRWREVLLGLSVLILVACSQDRSPINARPADRAVPAPDLIQKPGNYLIRGGEDVLNVFEAPANAIAYQVGEITGDYANGGLISDGRQPWFIHSAGDGSVWVYDVALGVVRWTYDSNEGWESVMLDEDSVSEEAVELAASIPQVFFSRLPQRLTDRWEPFRRG